MSRQIYLATPWLPTGGHWLINCLLEMGFKVSTYRGYDTDWKIEDGKHRVDGYKRFQKYIPAFQDNECFVFRDDIEIIWGHVFPYRNMLRHKVICFTRDPRDALYFQYAKSKHFFDLSYNDWLHWLFHESLLDAIDNWAVFHLLWWDHPDRNFFRFEDYRKNPEKTLGRVLKFMGAEVDNAGFSRALERSSYERYLRHSGRTPVPDARQYDFWKERTNEENAIREIEQRCGMLMRRLGYAVSHPDPDTDFSGLHLHMALNPFFMDIVHPAFDERSVSLANPYLLKVLAFYKMLDKGMLRHTTPLYRENHTFTELMRHLTLYLGNCLKTGIIGNKKGGAVLHAQPGSQMETT